MDEKQKKKSKPLFANDEEPRLVALKDFVICQNEYFKKIKAGDDLGDVPEIYHPNLKTEGVIN